MLEVIVSIFIIGAILSIVMPNYIGRINASKYERRSLN